MKRFNVTLPITGVIYVDDIEAETEKEAIEKAMEQPLTIDQVEEWQTHEQIVEGNVFHGHTNKASAEEVE